MLKTNNPSSVAPPAAMYSHSVEVPPNARWLFTAGQVGMRPDGTLAEGFEAQHEQIRGTRWRSWPMRAWARKTSSGSTSFRPTPMG